MPLVPLLDAVGRSERVVHVGGREAALLAGDRDARQGEALRVRGEHMWAAGPPDLRVQPRLDEQHASLGDVRGECLRGRTEAVEVAHEADRAEETGDDVEALAEVERAHVAFVQGQVPQTGASDVEQACVEVDAFAVEARTQAGEVLAGATGHVEERSCLRRPGADDLLDARALRLVILERVLEVVGLRPARIRHGRSNDTKPQRFRADSQKDTGAARSDSYRGLGCVSRSSRSWFCRSR